MLVNNGGGEEEEKVPVSIYKTAAKSTSYGTVRTGAAAVAVDDLAD